MKRLIDCAIVGALAAVCGCSTLYPGSQHYASSLLQYLYPDSLSHVDKPQVATLTLPLRVGVAFVPEDTRTSRAHTSAQHLSEEQKLKLLQQVSTNFGKYSFVRDIEIIPTAYLTPGGGFANVDQIRALFDIDIIALVSYDQLQFTDATRRSIAYLTVIGPYLINCEDNDTRTMLDAAVYDIRSRKLLFRAPGLSEIGGSSSVVNASQELREKSNAGFERASSNLAVHLEAELGRFRERIKDRNDDIQIVRSAGYTGGGQVGAFEFLVFGVAALGGIFSRRGKRHVQNSSALHINHQR